jgi:hypothetical protein
VVALAAAALDDALADALATVDDMTPAALVGATLHSLAQASDVSAFLRLTEK